MDIITSASNRIVKELRKLKQKKYRLESGLYIIEGIKMVMDAVEENIAIEYIVIDEDSNINFANFEQKGYNVYTMPSSLFQSVCDTVTPQGIIAAASIIRQEPQLPQGNCLVLDGISDAGNMGTIIRTAAAAGFWDLYLINCVDVYNPKSVRSTMSGLFYVRVHECGYDYLDKLTHHATLIGADMTGQDYRTVVSEITGEVAIVIGSESQGLSYEARGACKKLVSLPMLKVESLNAAVAAGVLMYSLSTNK